MKSSQVTIHDIARELKISASTVSRALSDNPRISLSTRKKVKELAVKLNYQPNIVASNLRTGRSKTIGVIVPHINRNFFSNVIGGIEETASNAGYRTIITQTCEKYEKEVDNVKALINARVDGILVSISGETHNLDHFNLVKQNKIPLLFFDRVADEIEANKVMVDDFKGAYKAVSHLINEGFRKIVHFAGPPHINVYKNRMLGYLEALNDNKIQQIDGYIFHDCLTEDKGWRSCENMMKYKNKPDAIFSASDISALGAIGYLKASGYDIPGDCAVVGFSNEPFTKIMEPGLTSIDQNSLEIGREVAALFLDEVHSAEKNDYKHIVIEPELIIRSSSLKKGV
ncbi:MAG: LacI family DNA-binding transcriptional regulator [Bacteroidales bacterium]|nr:LacI family DNA-binding transcriptional regulator [Bacteroidales bacterium]